MSRIVVPFILLLTAFLFACTNNCYLPKRALLGVSFVDSTALKPKDIENVTVKGVGNDSILYDGVSKLNVIYLPLKQNETSTSFEISFKATPNESVLRQYILTVSHNSFPQLISEECGCVMFHTVDSAWWDGGLEMPRIEVFNPNVINVENDVHLKIYM